MSVHWLAGGLGCTRTGWPKAQNTLQMALDWGVQMEGNDSKILVIIPQPYHARKVEKK